MAAAIADAMSGANLATKDDLAIAVRGVKIWTGSIAAAVAAILATAQHLWPPLP
jgi:hypothetical protein